MRALTALLGLFLIGCPQGDDDDSGVLPNDDDTAVTDDDDSAADDDDAAPDDDDTAPDDDDSTPPPTTVRFIAMGDVGTGFSNQQPASLVIESVCLAAGGCDFVLLMGDNFYDVGVDSVTDSQWDDKFEDPYANLDLPFYPVLGNHDGGLWGTGVELWKGDVQVEYSDYSDKWTMPGRYYKHSWGNVDLFGIDTSSVFFDGLGAPFITSYSDLTDDQASWLQSEWAGASTGDWRFVYGHHPYLSNGPHGNAGTYEGIPFVPYVSGDEIKDFLDDNVCGQADFYICGHDHSRQWMVDTCNGTQLVITGAGAKTSSIDGSQPTWFEDADTEGFFLFEITGNTATVQVWDVNGTMNYESVITK